MVGGEDFGFFFGGGDHDTYTPTGFQHFHTHSTLSIYPRTHTSYILHPTQIITLILLFLLLLQMSKQLSGLQKEILALYRTVLREAAKKDLQLLSRREPQPQPQHHHHHHNTSVPLVLQLWQDKTTTSSYAREEFRKQAASVKRNDFRTIEHKIRHGYKQVKLLQMPGVKVVGGSMIK